MFSGPDLVAAVKQRRWAKWTEMDHFVRFLLFICNFIWAAKEIPGNETSLHKDEFVCYTISSFLLVQTSTVQTGSPSFTEGHYGMRVPLAWESPLDTFPGSSLVLWSARLQLGSACCGGFGCLASARGTGEKLLQTWCAPPTSAAAVVGVGNPPLLSPLFLTAGRRGQIAFVNNFSNGKTKPGFSAMNRPLLSVVWITAILLF